MREFAYPARFAPDKKDGGFVVSFRDIPEAITQGETVDECREEAASRASGCARRPYPEWPGYP
jgi:antitoxin HicB